MTHCSARREGDEMFCARCSLRWDVNDPSAPICAPPQKRVIGIAGRAGSGKSTMARLVRLQFGQSDVLKFAAPLKAATRGLLIHQGFTSDEATRAIEGDLKRLPDERLGGLTPTQIMQAIGNGVRDDLDPDVWVRMARQRVAVSPAPVIIIDDVRYANEAAAVRRMGGRVVMITGREDANVSSGHASERFAFEPDLTFYNIGSVLDMERWIIAHLTR